MFNILSPKKRCSKCKQTKSVSEFFKSSRFADGFRKWCKKCDKASTEEWRVNNRDKFNSYTRKWRAEHPENNKLADRKQKIKRYGLSLQDYDEMYKAQRGKCAVCGERYETLCVDHDHKTGKVRGLLCDSCNKATGFIKDKPGIARAIASYLERRK